MSSNSAQSIGIVWIFRSHTDVTWHISSRDRISESHIVRIAGVMSNSQLILSTKTMCGISLINKGVLQHSNKTRKAVVTITCGSDNRYYIELPSGELDTVCQNCCKRLRD